MMPLRAYPKMFITWNTRFGIREPWKMVWQSEKEGYFGTTARYFTREGLQQDFLRGKAFTVTGTGSAFMRGNSNRADFMEQEHFTVPMENGLFTKACLKRESHVKNRTSLSSERISNLNPINHAYPPDSSESMISLSARIIPS